MPEVAAAVTVAGGGSGSRGGVPVPPEGLEVTLTSPTIPWNMRPPEWESRAVAWGMQW